MKKRLTTAAKIALTAGILWYVFRVTPLSEIITALKAAHLPLVVVGLLFDPVSLLLNAVNMKMLFAVHDAPLRIRSIMRINFTTEFYGFFLPGLISSGLIRWHQFTRASGKPAAVLATIAFVRLWDTAITFAVGLLFWLLDAKARSNAATGAVLIVCCLAALLMLFAVFNRKSAELIMPWIERRTFIPASIISKLRSVADSSANLAGAKKYVIGWTIVIVAARQLLGLLTFAFFAYALGMSIGIVSLGWVFFMLGVVLLLPITFSGIGVREGSLMTILAGYGIAAPQAVALSWLLFLNVLVLRLIGGLLESLRFLLQRGKPAEMRLPLPRRGAETR